MANPVVRRIIRIGRRRGEPRRRILAALATGRVESGFRNLPGGDADSRGWRQERRSLYRNPRNLRASINRFYNEAGQLDRGQSAGELAADVQRPAAQYRGRYAQVLAGGEPQRLLRGGGGVSRTLHPDAGTPASVTLARKTSFDRGGFEQAQRRALLANFLQRSGHGNSILFRSGLLSTTAPSAADFQTSRLTSQLHLGTLGQPGGGGGGGFAAPPKGQVEAAVRAAKKRLGIHEVGWNRGGKVDRMERRFGMVGQPWCGIFVGTVLKRAGVQGITSRVASVAAIEQDAQAGRNGFASWHSARQARRGDAVTFVTHSHVGFVTKVDRKRGLVFTIEGNTGTGTVARRVHRMSEIRGAARPRYR